MTRRKYLECIRGWLPKEPSIPNPQKTKMAEVNQTKKPTKTELAKFCIAVFAAVFITLTILGVLGLGSLAPFAQGVVAALAAGVSSFIVAHVLLRKPRNQS